MSEGLKPAAAESGLALVFAALLILASTLAAPALACFSPADPYAVEVLLNKPGVSYDLPKLSQMDGVVQTPSGAYVYKSRHDDRLLVVISEQGLELANAGQPTEGPVTTIAITGEGLDAGELAKRVGEALSKGSLSWKVNGYVFSDGVEGFSFTKVVDDSAVRVYVGADSDEVRVGLSVACATCEGELSEELASLIKSEVDALLAELELPEFGDLIDPLMVRDSLIRGPSSGGAERHLAVRVQVPIVQRVQTVTVFECDLAHEGASPSELKPEAAEELGWDVTADRGEGGLRFMMRKEVSEVSLVVSGTADERGVLRLVLRVERSPELRGDYLKELRSALDAIGLSDVSVDEGSFKKWEESVGSDVVPAFNVSESEVREALRAELRQLLDLGVTAGLTEEDISEIVARARLGNSGWNERIVWWEGRWIPYSETGLPLVKCFGPEPEFLSSETLDRLGVGELGLGAEQTHESESSALVEVPGDRIVTLPGAIFAIAILAAGSLAVLLIYTAAGGREKASNEELDRAP